MKDKTAVTDAWQTAIRDLDLAAIAKLLEEDPSLVEEGIVHTRRDGSTYRLLPLNMVNKSLPAAKLLVQAGADVNSRGDGGVLALHQANLEVTRFLLDQGADVNAVGYEDYAPLSYEIYLGNVEVALLLLERGADVNRPHPEDGNTALHLAARKGDLRLIQPLLDAGADRTLVKKKGQTPLDSAVERERSEEVLALLRTE